MLKFIKITNNAFTPKKATKDAAGFDLYAAYDTVVPAYSREIVNTDLKIQVPYNCYGRIAERSGLAVNWGIGVMGGVIDKDYTGPVLIILYNTTDQAYRVDRGTKVAQLICEVICYPELQEVEEFEKTERNENRFGSSDKTI